MSEKIISIKSRSGELYIVRVDEEDFARLVDAGPWHINTHGYAVHTEGRKCLYMHRVIMGLEEGDSRVVDHKNRDKLDNRKGNLRIVTQAENRRNCSKHKIGGSKFLGVSRTKSGFMARMYDFEGNQVYLGSFRHEVDAAEAYDRARLAAGLPSANFPSEVYSIPSIYTAEEHRQFRLEAISKDMSQTEEEESA